MLYICVNVKMASETSKRIFKEVKPILSLDHCEAKRRVLNLYRAWFRQIPYILKMYDLEYNEQICKQKLREEFMKHDKIKDIRVIDMLVIRGRMNLREMEEKWISRRGVAGYFHDYMEPKPKSFLGKFMNSKD